MFKNLKQVLHLSVILTFLIFARVVYAENLPSDGYNVSNDRWILLDDSSKYVTTYMDKNSIKLSPDKSKVFYDLKFQDVFPCFLSGYCSLISNLMPSH